MSPRQNRRRNSTDSADSAGADRYPGAEHTEDFGGVPYAVRDIRGSTSAKPYRCPGCDQQVRPGTPHVVAWPASDPDAGDRRHWHTPCWAARHRRGVKVHRAKNAPRYG